METARLVIFPARLVWLCLIYLMPDIAGMYIVSSPPGSKGPKCRVRPPSLPPQLLGFLGTQTFVGRKHTPLRPNRGVMPSRGKKSLQKRRTENLEGEAHLLEVGHIRRSPRGIVMLVAWLDKI